MRQVIFCLLKTKDGAIIVELRWDKNAVVDVLFERLSHYRQWLRF